MYTPADILHGQIQLLLPGWAKATQPGGGQLFPALYWDLKALKPIKVGVLINNKVQGRGVFSTWITFKDIQFLLPP
jgi:hypothetical protein